MLRYWAVQAIAVVSGGNPVVLAALMTDRLAEGLWLGQDAGTALLFLSVVACLCRRPRWLLMALPLLWLGQGLADRCGTLGWMRPLPYSVPLQLVWAPWRLPAGEPIPATSTVDGSVDWLLVSNNPEMVHQPGVVGRFETPAGTGRALISHINRSLTPRDLVVTYEGGSPCRILRFASARDGLGPDPGTALLRDFLASGPGPDRERGSITLPSLLGNGLIMLEMRTDGPLRWEVRVGEGSLLPRTGTQSSGVYPRPDRVVRLRYSPREGPRHFTFGPPWLEDLAGNYGAMTRIEIEVLDAPARVYLEARGGVLGTLAQGHIRAIPARSARLLHTLPPGKHTLRFTLPANSFAPNRLVLSE